MKTGYFITADIEGPHLSYFGERDSGEGDDKVYSVWTWADEDGGPEKGSDVIYFDNIWDAQDACNQIKERWTHHQFADTIKVTPLGIED